MNWDAAADIINKYFRDDDIQYKEAAYRKPYQSAKKFYEAGVFDKYSDGSYIQEIEKKTEDLRKERIKLQTANVERARVDRNISRQEMYFEQFKDMKEYLPLPEFEPLKPGFNSGNMTYLCCISDPHYGANFVSENNTYSPDVFKERLELLAGRLEEFICEKNVGRIHIACLGDTIQGILRVSDLKLNDTAVVKSVVEISRLLAMFLNEVSRFVEIEYYHVPSANHTQIRPLGTKANELADEDLEYVIGNYIKDLCSHNERIRVNLAEDGDQGIRIDIPGFFVYAMHGHQIKNISTALSGLAMKKREFIDYLILGHYHTRKVDTSAEGVCHDAEVLVCPSFVGSDPYADSLMKGSKAAVNIFGFDEIYGQTETYKIILN